MSVSPCDLRTYLDEAGRGSGAVIARALGVRPVMVSQWARKQQPKPIPEDRAPALERASGFRVRCEISCPNACWVRIPDPAWPYGRPLLDKAGETAPEACAVADADAAAQPYLAKPCSPLCLHGECAAQQKCMRLQREQVLHEAGEG